MIKSRFHDPTIELAHGSGGKASRRLVEGLIVPYFDNPVLRALSDAATMDVGGAAISFTADSFVVKPLRFPGGSIGEIAVNGTLNDLAVSGAQPLALVCSLILEAGLPSEVLQQEVEAIARASAAAGVPVVGGDTKVVEHGKADGMYITTAGIGLRAPNANLSAARVQPGDKIILSGPIGDHGITVLLARGELDLESDLQSDTRNVWPMVKTVLDAAGSAVRWMRDPTRGGVSSALNELARDAAVAVVLEETALPINDAVRGACELLGLEPLHVANEGQFLAVVAPESVESALAALRSTKGGEHATIIGEIHAEPSCILQVNTAHGSSRIVDMLVGDQLPRIC